MLDWDDEEEEEDYSSDDAGTYDRDDYNIFTEELRNAGFDVEDYNGRYFYHGPAVRAEDEIEMQNVIRGTTVNVQWDSMGMGYIVYPT